MKHEGKQIGEREWARDLRDFYEEMQIKLAQNDPKKGDSWRRTDWDIEYRLREEVSEARWDEADASEWADVANFAFFAWWRKKHHRGDAASVRGAPPSGGQDAKRVSSESP